MCDPVQLDPAVFRAKFSEFGDDSVYTDAKLAAWWVDACAYMAPDAHCAGLMSEQENASACNLSLAHCLRLDKTAADGAPQGVATSASQGGVSVGFAAPIMHTSREYWLSKTPYGQQLLALLRTVAAGGFSVGGLPEVRAFRKVGGVF